MLVNAKLNVRLYIRSVTPMNNVPIVIYLLLLQYIFNTYFIIYDIDIAIIT